MNFTKRTEYALRALLEIGTGDLNVPVKREMIAKNQKISSQFLEQIFIPMMKDGIIRSVRGPGGGFVLNKLPEEINTWDVFCTVDNSNKLYDYCSTSTKNDCDLIDNCKIKFVWQQIDTALKDTMEKITLSDIIKS